jgi:ribosome-binding protein aMBF1 (putative translation factor)
VIEPNYFATWRIRQVAKAHEEDVMPKKPELSEEDAELRRAFGERLRDTRESMKKSPAELAAIGGISVAHQYRIEAGDRTADVLYLQKLVRRFGAMFGSALLDVDLGQSPVAAKGAAVQSNSGAGAVQIGSVGKNVAIRGRR